MNTKDKPFFKRVAVTGVILPFFVIGFIMFLVGYFKDLEHAVLLGSELGKFYFFYLTALGSVLIIWKLVDDLKGRKTRR